MKKTTPDRRAAFLRAVNIGTARRVSMQDLRRIVEAQGYTDVRTVLNSGNVVFTIPRRSGENVARRLERALEQHSGVSARVIVLTRDELRAAIENNPLQDVADVPSRLLVMVLADDEAADRVAKLGEESWAPEVLAVRGRVAYLWCANGIAAGELAFRADRAVRNAGTARNLATMKKVLALMEPEP